jgi:hypothetical protein
MEPILAEKQKVTRGNKHTLLYSRQCSLPITREGLKVGLSHEPL